MADSVSQDGQENNCREMFRKLGGWWVMFFGRGRYPHVVQDGPKVLPDRFWIEQKRQAHVNNITQTHAKKRSLIDPGAAPSWPGSCHRSLTNVE